MVRRLKLFGRQYKNHKRQELQKINQPKFKWTTSNGKHLQPIATLFIWIATVIRKQAPR